MSDEKQTEIEEVHVQHDLKFDLTREDKARIMDEVVELKDQLNAKETEFANLKKSFTNDITSLTAQISDRIKLAKQGFEERNVPCTLRKDFATATAAYWFEGRKFEERELTPAERQRSLELAQPIFDLGGAEGRPVVVDNVLVGSFQEEGEKVNVHPDIAAIIKEETNRKTKVDESTT